MSLNEINASELEYQHVHNVCKNISVAKHLLLLLFQLYYFTLANIF